MLPKWAEFHILRLTQTFQPNHYEDGISNTPVLSFLLLALLLLLEVVTWSPMSCGVIQTRELSNILQLFLAIKNQIWKKMLFEIPHYKLSHPKNREITDKRDSGKEIFYPIWPVSSSEGNNQSD